MWLSHINKQSRVVKSIHLHFLSIGLMWHLYSYLILPVPTGVLDQIYSSFLLIKTFHLFDSQPGYPVANDECRNATVLMVMSPLLACVSQEAFELHFGQTKASITETPRGDFEFFLCPFAQCILYETWQVLHFLSSLNWLVFIFLSHSYGNAARYTLYPQNHCRANTILVTLRAWCNSQEILSGLPPPRLFLTCGFLKSLDAFMVGNKDKLGLRVIPGVLLSCHLATTRQLAARDVALWRAPFFLSSVFWCCHILCQWQVLCRPLVCARMQGHTTPLWQQDLHYRPPDAFCWQCIFASAAVCLSAPLFLFCFLIFLSFAPLTAHSFAFLIPFAPELPWLLASSIGAQVSLTSLWSCCASLLRGRFL